MSFRKGEFVISDSSGIGKIIKARYDEPFLPNTYYVETKHDQFWADEEDLKKIKNIKVKSYKRSRL